MQCCLTASFAKLADGLIFPRNVCCLCSQTGSVMVRQGWCPHMMWWFQFKRPTLVHFGVACTYACMKITQSG